MNQFFSPGSDDIRSVISQFGNLSSSDAREDENNNVAIKDDCSSVLFMTTPSDANYLISSILEITNPLLVPYDTTSKAFKASGQALQKHMRFGSQQPEFFDDLPSLYFYVKDKFRFRALSAVASVRAAKEADLLPPDPLFLSMGGGPGSDAFGCLLAMGAGSTSRALVFDFAVGWKHVVDNVAVVSNERVSWGGVCDVKKDLTSSPLEEHIISSRETAIVVVFHYVLCEAMRSCNLEKNTDDEVWMTLLLSIEASWCKVVTSGISDVLPVCIVAHA